MDDTQHSPQLAVPQRVADAWLAACLFAIDPAASGGIVVRACAGPVRDRWTADLRASLPSGAPWRSVPIHVEEDRLLGGIDLAATLSAGRPIAARGLLAEADGGVLVLSMAERVTASTAGHVAAVLDSGSSLCARHGVVARAQARLGVIALDEGDADDERPPAALLDRLAFHVDLRDVGWRDAEAAADPAAMNPRQLDAARIRWAAVEVGDGVVEALCSAAVALGVDSVRACIQALKVARLAAALAGRSDVGEAEASLAARLVLAPRATRMPSSASSPEHEGGDQDEEQPANGEAEPPSSENAGDESDVPGSDAEPSAASLDDVVLAAAAAAIPSGLLDHLVGFDGGRSPGSAGRAGGLQSSTRRGRPTGARRQRPRGGARLDVLATLRAAAPWQLLRTRERGSHAGALAPILIRTEDFHVTRRREHRRTTAIFAVDASGSAALHRLGEAKGAVELLLADCYVRRDSVAVLAFRGRSAQLLLPPTRSLARAKRSLAELPGGGGTPLANGIDAARELAALVRRRGDRPVVIVLSDGRANVARDGRPGRAVAEAEARSAALLLHQEAFTSLFVDTSPHPNPAAREIAEAMGARYLALPHAEAATLSAVVGGITGRPTDR